MLLSSFLAALLAGQALPEIVEAPVLDRMVERGEILSAGDFTTEPLSPSQARGAMTPDAVSGMEASRRLRAGAIVRANDVIAPRLVRRGEPVTINIRSGGLTITTAGRALADGAMGDLVRVVASSTNRTLDAEVEASGSVRVTAL
jgi:flagella basal body P-ring formation protein FlgA